MNRKTRIVLFVGMIGLCAAIVYFAPMVTGSVVENIREQADLDQALSACKPNDVIYFVYYGQQGQESARFDLATKKLVGSDAQGATGGSWLAPAKSVFYNTNIGSGATYTDDDITKIKSLLATMPEPIVPTVGTISYRDQLHLAFYRNGHQVIYHYPKLTAPPQLADLCKALRIPEHAN